MNTMVERIKSWGFNTVVYEMGNKFRFSKHMAIWHPEAPTHENTVALVQSLGHAEYVVGKPEYAHLRETPENRDQYDPLSSEAQTLILELFDEVIDVMKPREFFYMGGDETWSLGKSQKCRSVVEKIGTGGLYLQCMSF